MVPSTASPRNPDPDAIEFVRFCYRRRRVGWPELYDEMCAVGSRGLFRGLGPDDLAAFGIGFCLFDMPALAALTAIVVAEEQARRRPVAVQILAEIPPGPIVEERPDQVVAATDGLAASEAVEVAVETQRDAVAAAAVDARPDQAGQRPEPAPERTVDVPIRLVTAPA
jgi:hypothetical protein